MARSMAGRMFQGLILTGAAAALVGAVTVSACDQAPSTSAQDASTVATAAPPAGAGMRTYTDPSTGEILDRAPAGAAPAAAPRSVPALRESPGTTPAGGVKLEGDFRMDVRTRTDAGGRTVTDCVPAAAAGQE